MYTEGTDDEHSAVDITSTSDTHISGSPKIRPNNVVATPIAGRSNSEELSWRAHPGAWSRRELAVPPQSQWMMRKDCP